MQVPLQIVFRDIERSEALESRVRAESDKLERFHSRITSGRVTIEEEHRHQSQGREFSVNIDVRIPGRREIVATARHEDVYVAVRDAFDAARRQLEDAAGSDGPRMNPA